MDQFKSNNSEEFSSLTFQVHESFLFHFLFLILTLNQLGIFLWATRKGIGKITNTRKKTKNCNIKGKSISLRETKKIRNTVKLSHSYANGKDSAAKKWRKLFCLSGAFQEKINSQNSLTKGTHNIPHIFFCFSHISPFF